MATQLNLFEAFLTPHQGMKKLETSLSAIGKNFCGNSKLLMLSKFFYGKLESLKIIYVNFSPKKKMLNKIIWATTEDVELIKGTSNWRWSLVGHGLDFILFSIFPSLMDRIYVKPLAVITLSV